MPRAGEQVIKRARSLRANPTEAERALWRILTSPPFDRWRFRRQHPVSPYIVDFACVKRRLAIEADGGQHCDNAHDERRDAFLTERGWRVLRLWNNDVLANPDGVRQVIAAALAETGPHPDPPPDELGEGE